MSEAVISSTLTMPVGLFVAYVLSGITLVVSLLRTAWQVRGPGIFGRLGVPVVIVWTVVTWPLFVAYLLVSGQDAGPAPAVGRAIPIRSA